jgi:hypothetical protein
VKARIGLAAIIIGLTSGIETLSAETPVFRLPSSTLSMSLTRCRVEVITQVDEDPSVRVERRDGSEVSIESTGLSLKNGVIRVKSDDEQKSLSDFIFSFTLLPAQNFEIDGTDLDLVITGPEISQETEGDLGGTRSIPGLEDGCATPRLLNLIGGTAHLIGGGCTKIVSANTDLSLEHMSQTLEIQAAGGRFTIREHRGKIILNGRDNAGGVIVDHEGDLELVMSEGQMLVDGGVGAIQCQSDHFGLHVTNHQGPLNATGTVASFRIDNSSVENTRLTGDRTIASFSTGQGHIQTTLMGGSLTIDDWVGRVDLRSSEGTTLEIDGVDGDFALTCFDTTGELTGITGHTRGTLTNSRIEFSRSKSIQLMAEASQTTVTDIPVISQMIINDGFLKYESSVVGGRPKIALSGGAVADIVFPQPCVVRFSGPGAQSSGNTRVSGCEIRRPGQPWGTQRNKRAEKRIQLEVEMSEETAATVWSY